MATTTSRLGGINLVMIPTNDQDKGVEFYVDKLGFEKRTDVPFGGGYRWIEVYPPDGTAGIALAPPRPGEPAQARETGISLKTDDADAAHAQLKEAGVDVDDEVSHMGGPVPPMFWFRDPEGNSLMVVQVED